MHDQKSDLILLFNSWFEFYLTNMTKNLFPNGMLKYLYLVWYTVYVVYKANNIWNTWTLGGLKGA